MACGPHKVAPDLCPRPLPGNCLSNWTELVSLMQKRTQGSSSAFPAPWRIFSQCQALPWHLREKNPGNNSPSTHLLLPKRSGKARGDEEREQQWEEALAGWGHCRCQLDTDHTEPGGCQPRKRDQPAVHLLWDTRSSLWWLQGTVWRAQDSPVSGTSSSLSPSCLQGSLEAQALQQCSPQPCAPSPLPAPASSRYCRGSCPSSSRWDGSAGAVAVP